MSGSFLWHFAAGQAVTDGVKLSQSGCVVQ